MFQLNEISGKYPCQNDFPDYHPHMTVGYIKKRTFPYKKEGFSIKIPIKEICYSPISGGKSYFQLEKENGNIKENNSNTDVDSQISKLEQEWDRLDKNPAGCGDRQREISQELEKLRGEQGKKLVEPNSSRSKELFANIRNSIK